jgi:FSR family fosmidomycin resistance protein-like MFS transporter
MRKSLFSSNLLGYSFIHLIVDLISAAIIFNILFLGENFSDWFFLAILYNVLAFGTQAIFGYALDTFRKPKQGALFSMALLSFAVALIYISPAFSVIFAGLGNALFHVSGGTISLNLTPKKATAPGIYVSLGALGLFMGTLIGKMTSFISFICLPLILLSLVIISVTRQPKIDYSKKSCPNYSNLLILLFLIVIVSRAFVGSMLSFPWKSNIWLAFVLILAIVLGKSLGGFLADKLGWIKVSVGGLLLSAPLFFFGSQIPAVALLGSFLFNFTMPVTLVALSNTLQGNPGFAFGLTTLALLLGALPGLIGLDKLQSVYLLGIILITAGILYASLNLLSKKDIKSRRSK